MDFIKVQLILTAKLQVIAIILQLKELCIILDQLYNLTLTDLEIYYLNAKFNLSLNNRINVLFGIKKLLKNHKLKHNNSKSIIISDKGKIYKADINIDNKNIEYFIQKIRKNIDKYVVFNQNTKMFYIYNGDFLLDSDYLQVNHNTLYKFVYNDLRKNLLNKRDLQKKKRIK